MAPADADAGPGWEVGLPWAWPSEPAGPGVLGVLEVRHGRERRWGWKGPEFSVESLGIPDRAQFLFLLLFFSFVKINMKTCLALIIVSAAT